MILSRSSASKKPQKPVQKNSEHNYLDFVARRDYTGALTILQFQRNIPNLELWIAYCYFHAGSYEKALDIYKSVKKASKEVLLNLACCYFFLGMYQDADKCTNSAEASPLKSRLQFHLAHKMGEEKRLLELHKILEDVVEDQLSLASIHYLRSHYQEAIDIYKKILVDNREYVALNVYIALCYYKLDFFDISQEVLNVYLQQFPDSITAVNLKACNNFKLYTGKTAEGDIKSLSDQNLNTANFGCDLIKHNLVVFRGGDGALQILPPLLDIIPEARLNLVIYYLKHDEVKEAYDLMKDLEPSVPQEYILKGTVSASMGQNGNREHLKIAQQYFQLVGNSPSECDTIPGRQCMASYLFLQHQFDQVHLYLNSIKSYFDNDDSFNFNLAQSQAALGNFAEAEETFNRIQGEKLKEDYCFISHMCRCLIINKKPQKAWDLYQKLDNSAESFTLLQLIANDCYKMGEFLHAAKAFDLLERLDQSPEYWEGKRGACCGIFQMIVARKLPRELLAEAVGLLRNSANAQAEIIIKGIKTWAKENRVPV